MIRSFVIVGLVPSFLALLEFNFANPDEIAFYLGLGLFLPAPLFWWRLCARL